MKKIGFIFPGQGAQVPGMGKDFAEAYQEARYLFEEADDILQRNLSKIVWEGPLDLLTETQNSQAGIFVTSLALLHVVQKQFPSLKPFATAGLSLGEYTAITASHRLSFQDTLPLVDLRGRYMNEACETHPGTMVVVMGMDAPSVERMVSELQLPNDLWVANLNCPGQVVISGTLKGIELGSAKAKELGAKRVLPLTVHGAFHSGLMQSAEDQLASAIHSAPFQDSEIGLVMNYSGDFVPTTDLLRKQLIKQVTSPVRWEQGIKAMVERGVDLFIEVGCGKTLAGLNKRIGILIPTLSIEKVEDLESLGALA